LITDEITHQKMACGDPKAAARIAILDPVLTLSQPPRVTACTGIDAVAHAVETAVTRKRSSLSALFSHESFKLTMAALPRVLQSPDDLEARGWMLLGAAWAGTAIENSMLGAAHSAANPLTAHYGIVHGHAVGVMLPHVVRFNSRDADAATAYVQLSVHARLAPDRHTTEAAAEQLAQHLERLLDLARLPRSLKTLGVRQEDIPRLAAEAAAQWTAQFNPRTATAGDFEAIYTSVFD
jgi:alcohol dehydrogenase